MIDPATLRFLVAFVALFLFGRLLSLGLYQACWRNAKIGDLKRHGAVALLLRRPWLWPIHFVVLFLTSRLSWSELGVLHPILCMTAVTLAWGSVFRFGASDLRRYFFVDRLVVVSCCIGVYFSPVFLYPTIVTGCALQYIVSRWPLGPGYSNLLGFEMIRGSASVLLGCLIAYEPLQRWILPPSDAQAVMLSVWICVLGSYYVNHAFAKAALGRRWYSWVLENRLECLVVNSYLRGWRAKRDPDRVLAWSHLVRRFRIPLCGITFLLEFGFLFALLDRYVLTAFLMAITAFHVGVFVVTGLAEIEFAVNHMTLAWLLTAVPSPIPEPTFGASVVAIAIPCTMVHFIWVGTLRKRLFSQFQSTSQPQSLALADPFDHLMAWWDSPYMRMFTYVGVTDSGERLSIPVCKLSPYDTALTDIHTHIMLLNLHEAFDPQVEFDRQICRSGVWGLLISQSDRDSVYGAMDQTDPDLSPFESDGASSPWQCDANNAESQVAAPLRHLFLGINEGVSRRWFRQWMRYPHFPGEDLVPDICPLSNHTDGEYGFDRRVKCIKVERIKTFYTGDRFEVVEHADVGTIDL